MGSLFSMISEVWSTFRSDKPARILLVGLDAAGKTTILNQMTDKETIQTLPTIGRIFTKIMILSYLFFVNTGFNVETVSPCPGVVFTVWDVSCRSFYFHKLFILINLAGRRSRKTSWTLATLLFR